MQRRNGDLVLSPSDLNAFLACEHLTALELAAARGQVERPVRDNPSAELIRRKGDEHEAAYLQSLLDAGKSVRRIELGDGEAWDLERAAADATADAGRTCASRDARAAPRQRCSRARSRAGFGRERAAETSAEVVSELGASSGRNCEALRWQREARRSLAC